MKRIIVTGGAGFLGSNLCRKLLREKKEVEVVCVDNFYTGSRDNIADLTSEQRFSVMEHDVIEPFPAEFKCDEIYNLACPASPPHYQRDHIYTTKTCVMGALNVLDLAKRCGASVLQASTSEVYGEPNVHPQPESYRGNVSCTGERSCYDEGKRCAESLFFNYHRMYGTKIKVIRIFNTYGPYMDINDGRVVSNFIVQCLQNKPLTVYGDGKQTRSLCYVDDLLEGMVRMMEADDDFIGPVNLGNPEEYTVGDIAALIKALTGSEAAVTYHPLPADDPTQRRPDITLAGEKLAWRPKIGAKEGLKQTIEYFRRVLGE